MTVKELIEKLQTMDQDLIVLVKQPDYSGGTEFEELIDDEVDFNDGTMYLEEGVYLG